MSRRKTSPTPPLEWLKARLKRDERSPTGFVWKERPKGDFKTEAAWRGWNTTFAGGMAGAAQRNGYTPYISIRYGGHKDCLLDVRALKIAFDEGEWPTGKLPPWPKDIVVSPRQDDLKRRLRVTAGYVGEGVLARYFADECQDSGFTPDELTVLQRVRDPFRLDIPTKRRDAEWFTDNFNRFFGQDREGHLREIHYVLATDVPPIHRPNGAPYTNIHKDWRWLLNEPAKTARWLGLVPWHRIIDNRSDPPVLHRVERAGEAEASFLVGLPVPDKIDVTPTPDLEGFDADQPFALALFAEKSSPAEVLASLAERLGANFYPGGGDQVDRRIWEIARDAHADGRKLILFTVCDCDPGGWNMPIAIARKLQAFSVSEFPDLEFEVVRAGLTPAQVRVLGLPGAPLKLTEKRADRWREAMGVEQTELDAAMALKREEFIAAVEEAIRLYFDETLEERVAQAQLEWEGEAEAAIEEQIDAEEIASLQARYDAARAEIEAINKRLSEIVEDIDLPDPPDPPEPDMDDKIELRSPLIDSDWGFVEGTRKLKANKAYEDDEADDGE
jgi:hypothetical protein